MVPFLNTMARCEGKDSMRRRGKKATKRKTRKEVERKGSMRLKARKFKMNKVTKRQ